MAIEKLSDAAVRTLGATQVLVDAASLVKELVDNALDAHATTVAIEVSLNTIDIVQVRDNGHGIAPEDRSLVATPNCTSKLHDFDALKTVGGNSLGFRGQALAAAAEMSGAMMITTRIEGELVAAALKINQRGEAVGQDRASAPVGTTVRVTDFMKAHPVRRQRAIKDAEKTLKQIKQTLQAYALARPSVRLSLRILKAKNEKCNFVYAPRQGGSAEDAALKVVGSACVSQCTWLVHEKGGFTLQAFLPRPDAELSKVSGPGPYLSVDGRPVSASRGTLKQIVKMYRESLKAANPQFDDIKEPFIYMRMLCPSASYDPNIEPAKDDVLFEDADQVLTLARQMFDELYSRGLAEELVAGAVADGTLSDNRIAAIEVEGEDFMTSLESVSSAVPVAPMQMHVRDDSAQPPRRHNRTPKPPAFRSNMYGCDQEDLELYKEEPSNTTDEAEVTKKMRRDVKLSNPWVTAKLNASLRPRAAEKVAEEMVQTSLLDEMGAQIKKRQGDGCNNGLPTPRPSSPSPPAEAFHPSDHVSGMRLARDGRVIGPDRLPSPRFLPRSAPSHELTTQEPTPVYTSPTYNYALTQSSPQPSGTPLSAIPNAPSRPRGPKNRAVADAVNRPFVSPLNHRSPRENVWFDHLEGEVRPRQKPSRQNRPPPLDSLVQQGELGDLIDEPRPRTPPRRNRDIREFVGSGESTGSGNVSELIERRYFARPNQDAFASRQSYPPYDQENFQPSRRRLSHHGFIRASEVSDPGSSPDKSQVPPLKRRRTGEGLALRQLSTNAPGQVQRTPEFEHPPLPSSVERRQATLRRKSSRLPLERIPKKRATHNFALNVAVSTAGIRAKAAKIIGESSWNQNSFEVCDAFAAVTEQDVGSLSAGLQRLLRKLEPEAEVAPDLCAVLHEALLAQRTQAGSEGSCEAMLSGQC